MRQLFLVFVALTIISCRPDSKEFIFPDGIIINTLPVKIPGGESILLYSDIIIEGEISLIDPEVIVIEHGLIWGVGDNYNQLHLPDSVDDYNTPPMGYSELGSKISPGKFQSMFNISGLFNYSEISGEVEVSARAYAVTNKGIAYGEVVNFMSYQQVDIATSSSPISFDQVSLSATILQYRGITEKILDYGFVWLATDSPYEQPTIYDNKVSGGAVENSSIISNFDNTITGLYANTAYNYRAYIVTEDNSVWYSSSEYSNNTFITTERTGWVLRTPFPGELGQGFRSEAKSFAIGTKGYYGFGNYTLPGTSTSVYARDFWEYDTETDIWTRLADFPGLVDRIDEISFSIGNKGYYGLGRSFSTHSTDIWEYEPSKDTWTLKTNFPGTSSYHQSVFVIGDKAYIGAGDPSGTANASDDFWSYNASNSSWQQIASYPLGPLYNANAFSINGLGYVGLGYDGLDDANLKMASYDPSSNTWSEVLSAPNPLSSGTDFFSFSLNNIGYVGPIADGVWQLAYDPLANTWLNSEPGPYGIFTSFSNSSKGYIVNAAGIVREFNP